MLALCLFSVIALAQSESGSAALEGVVSAPGAQVVAGATVTVRNIETGYTRTLSTDERGRFIASVMPVGLYAVEVKAGGFATARREGVRLMVGQTETIDLGLQVASVSEQVTVSSDAATLDTEEGASGSTIIQRSVADLPIRGRNFTEFVQLSPAIVQESDRFGLVISGQRSINSNVAIDGADFNDPVQGNQRGGNESVFFFPQTAVREFQVVRSGASAEVGRTGAGFVNVVTKSGTNEWHGEAFYFNRNRHLTSADAFDRKLDNAQSQFGGSVGGPLQKDRAFFFIGAEQNFLRVPFVVQFQPQAAGVTVPADLLALQGEQHGTNNPTAVFVRTDFTLSPQNSLNVQYTYARLRGENFNFDSPQLDSAATANFKRTTDSHGGKVGLVTVFTPSFINEFRAQIATDFRDEAPNALLPQIVITGFGTIGGDTGRPRLFESTRYELADNISLTGGAHRLRFGFDYNLNRVAQQRESNILGRYDFTSLANYIARKISRYRQTVSTLNADALTFRGHQQELAFFAQDKVALRRNLTLTAGLRWEGQWNPQPTNPNPAIPQSARIPNDLAQWQPRLALAWDVRGRASTVIRLSAGILDARTPANLFQRVFTDNGTNALAVDSKTDAAILNLVQFPNPLASFPAGLKVPAQRVFGFEPNFRNPRSFQTAATIEQRLGTDLVVSLGYVHNSTWNLQRRLDRNLFRPTIDATGLPVFPKTRPNPNFAQIEINESSAHSRYDAAVLTATKRLSRRFQLQANYTLAYNRDDDSNERNFSRETALNPFDLSIENTWSKQDVRHNFNLSSLVDLPWGFTVSGILFARSAFPFTPVIGSDQQNDANDDNDRAIIFNGTGGRVAGRNSLRQPGFFDLDLRLLKAFRLGEHRHLDFTAEFFNVTRASNKNFANDSISVYGTPAAPVVTAGQPLFAPSTARFGGPRQLQLGVRMVF
ncbi:MAG TPA: carboxypeptidase regulatory-like domain-containing protein [Blastocatellia bacterium]|nr:carboxypeptidase regulatory-like domain-containing protein [Blastocatellia bacterium]